jgi:hypothetical protein
MDSGNGTFIAKYNGNYHPGTVEATVTGLTNGAFYKFRVKAINYNG